MRKALRRLAAVVTAGLIGLGAYGAVAACVGQNLLETHRAKDPEGIAAMFARAHDVANAQGLFWEISRPGTPTSYLFGTFHAPSVADAVPQRVWDLLETARVTVFEIDLEQQAAMAARMSSDPTFAFDFEAPPLSSRLTPEERLNISRALAARGIPMASAQQMRPWLLASLLGFPACHLKAAARGAKALDVTMAERAAAAGRPVVGLESYENALAAFEAVDADAMIRMLSGAGKSLDIEEDIFRTNSDLYAAGNVQAINEYSIWIADQIEPDIDNRALNTAMMEQILDARNRSWMPSLVEHLADGNAIVAVGALHLPGDAGLIELLRAEGYRVTRIDDTSKK